MKKLLPSRDEIHEAYLQGEEAVVTLFEETLTVLAARIQALGVSGHTIKYHVSQILERLQLKSRYELARYAQEQG